MSTTTTEILSERIHEVRRKFETHEAVCAQRYQNIEDAVRRVDKRVSGTNGLLLTVAGATVMQLLAVLGYLLANWKG